MKILIVSNMAPFIRGGAEEHASYLQKNLIIAGHEAEILRIPFQWDPVETIPSQMMMARAFELYNVDHVIAMKFPAYLIRHPSKTLWFLHQYRQAYDLYDAGHTNIPKNSFGDDLRALIRTADNETFRESKSIFTISEVTQQRLAKYNGIESKVLTPPMNDPELFTGGGAGDYIFAGGRVNDMKRQYLLLEAMSKASSQVKLVIAGPPDGPEDKEKLTKMVERFGLEDRVLLDIRFVPRELYAKYVNESAAVAYLPFDEDCMGYVTIEAATAAKPIITATDSGGVLALVKHHKTGWVTEPTAEGLALAMNAVFSGKKCAQQYGEAAKELFLSYGINWPNTIEVLLR